MANINITFGPGNSLSRDISNTADIRRSWLEALGADPERVEFVVNGRPYSGALADGDTVEVRTRANEKGAVRISFGTGNSLSRDIDHTDEIDDGWIDALGADPNRVQFFRNGSPYTGPLTDGDEIELRTLANEKGC